MWLGFFAVGGAILGYGFYQLRAVKDWTYRFGLGAIVGAILIYLAINYLGQVPAFTGADAQRGFAVHLLIGLPFFYLLTFCGEAEESEVEIAALCAGLGVGLYLLRLSTSLPEFGDKLIFLVPLGLYFAYSRWWMPRLRVFKHTLRGYGALSLGRYREAMLNFSRALQLDRRNRLAAEGMWRLVRRVDVSKLDDETARLLPFEFCLSMASATLVGERTPTPAERDEAVKTLTVIERHRPDLSARADYLRAVALTHAKQFEAAADVLRRLLDPETPYAPEARRAALFGAWDLALRLHPELVKRLGAAELAKPGRRIEAIAAVERQLAANPGDPGAEELKRDLYAGLSEAEFVAAAATVPPAEFNYEYVEQLGYALVGDADPGRVERGMAYLRVAGRGLPTRGPSIFKNLADLATKLGRPDEAHGYLGQVKRAGLTAGPANLPADQKELYFAALKSLSEDGVARGDFAAAVEDMRLYVEGGREDVNSLRQLAELYAKNGDALNALLITERGLLYAKTDRDLLAKKDSYYYSVDVEKVRSVKDKVAGWFDVDYCTRKARQIAEQKEPDLDTVEWGLHLIRLAKVMKPEGQAARVAEARLLLRKGERDAALALLEDVRSEKRGSGDDEDAWFIATKLLGDLYLDELDRPDLAIGCYTDYREYQRSGADTIYRLGEAYEKKGDVTAAIKAFELVTAYQNHPRYWDATEAVRRLKEGAAS
jgi:tetratricopeptide (TPR) repeat protein